MTLHRNIRFAAVGAVAALALLAAPLAQAAELAAETTGAVVAQELIQIDADATEIVTTSDAAEEDDAFLSPGETLTVGQVLKSKNGKFGFFVSKIGQVYSFKYASANTGYVQWQSNTNNVTKAVFNNNGRLRLLDSDGELVMRSNNDIVKDADKLRFVVTNNGKCVIRVNGNKVWELTDAWFRPGGGDDQSHSKNTLLAGKKFVKGDQLESVNGRYIAKLNDKGNLVVRDLENDEAIWKSDTKNEEVVALMVRKNGVAVLLNEDGDAVWKTDTAAKNPSNPRMMMLNDGRLIVAHGQNIVWSSR